MLIKVHPDTANEPRGLDFGLSLYLHSYFMYASREGADLPEHSLLAEEICTKNRVHCPVNS